MFSTKQIVGLCASALLLASCASAAKPGAMMVPVDETRIIAQSSPLFESVAVDQIEGGKETSPLWKSNVSNEDFAEALRQSLSAHTMLAVGDATYSVQAELVKVKQPVMGFSFTVTSTVKYTVRDADDAVVFEQEIVSPYTASMSDAFVGVERLRLANEGSIKENISQFLDGLIAEVQGQPQAPASDMTEPALSSPSASASETPVM
ncbi:MAG: hypothetical protein AAF337_15325 [Pseudomonadota bacterium]